MSFLTLICSCSSKEKLDLETENEKQYIQVTMLQRLSIFFCTGDVYFRSCFDTNPDECVEQVESDFDDCLPKDMPMPFEGKPAAIYSQELGECIGRSYDVSMRKKGKYIGKKNPTCSKVLERSKVK